MSTNPYDPPSIPSDQSRPPPFEPSSRHVALLAASQIGIGSAAGFAIWSATAPAEAWDVNRYYSVCVLLSGLVASLARPRGFHWGVVGVYLGQLLALWLLIPAEGGFVFPGALVLLFGTVPAVVGALLGAAVGFAIQRMRGKKSSN